MTLGSESRPRTRTRPTRRLSPCYRHPDEPHTGICPSCLRERLDSFASAGPELRRCRSVVSDSKSSATFTEPRRNSCDVVSARSSLSNLFDDEDVKTIGSSEIVESKNLGLSRVTYTIIESKNENDDDEIRVPIEDLGVTDAECVADGENEGGECRTMKEYIDLEFENRSNKSKDLRGSLWGAASVFSRKLRKWRLKNNHSRKMKELHSSSSDEKSCAGGDRNLKMLECEESRNEVLGRRSCDTEPRFSVEAGRISVEEPRASWDGYMIARTIPRLAPMLSVVENGMLGDINRFENNRLSVDGQMHSIVEDESSSRGSGNSNSDSSSSMVRSSFDRSSSVRSFGKKVESSEDHGVSPANVKLVITEKELKDWRLNSSKDKGVENSGSFLSNSATVSVGNSNVPPKKSVRWHKIYYNVFGFRLKNGESKSESVKENPVDSSIDDIRNKQGNEAGEHRKDINGWKLTRSSSVVGPRNSCDGNGSNYRRRSVDNAGGWDFKRAEEFVPERNRIADYSATGLENGLTPFYLTPLRSLRSSKSGKFKLQHSHSIAGKILHLNRTEGG